MAFVVRTYSTTCLADLLNAVNADVGITTFCKQIIDNQSGDLIFDFDGTPSAGEETALDAILAGWVCPPIPPDEDPDGTAVINDSSGPDDEVLWTSEKIQQQIDDAINGVGVENVAVVSVSKSTTTPMPTSFSNIVWDNTDIQNAPDKVEHSQTNLDRILIKETGLYLVSFNASVDANAGEDQFDFRVMVNDTTQCPGTLRTISEDDEINAVSNSVPCEFTAGEYVTLQTMAAATGNVLSVTTNFSLISLRNPKGEKGDKGDPGTGTTVVAEEEGSNLGSFDTFNFKGDLITASDAGSGVLDIDVANPLFGSEYQYAESLSVATTNATVYVQKLKMTTTNLPAGTYRIGWSFLWNHDSAQNDFLGRLQLDDTTTLVQLQIEPKDSGGSFDATGTNQKNPASGFLNVALSGVHEIDIDFSTSNAGTTSGLWDARIELWRIS